MCSLDPLDERTAKQIAIGQVPEIPECYSKNISVLIEAMLRLDSHKRINIYQVCEMRKINNRIKKFLGKEKYEEEFNQNEHDYASHQPQDNILSMTRADELSFSMNFQDKQGGPKAAAILFAGGTDFKEGENHYLRQP